MREEKVVQFVCFETPLTRTVYCKMGTIHPSADSDLDVKLQQSEKNGLFKYLVQHRCKSGNSSLFFKGQEIFKNQGSAITRGTGWWVFDRAIHRQQRPGGVKASFLFFSLIIRLTWDHTNS
jgi:hypothetical protein